MDNQIDPRFQEARKRASRRRRRGRAWKLALPIAGVLAVGALIGLTWDKWSFGAAPKIEVAEEELAVDLVALEQDAAASSSAFAAAFIDLAGDPMLIRFDETATTLTNKDLVVPDALGQSARLVPDMVLVTDVMVSAEERFITTLPSSQDDFAFFKAQKSGAVSTPVPVVAEIATGDAAAAGVDDADAGWGESLEDGEEGDTTIRKTRIENTTSIAFVRPEKQRAKLSTDVFVKIAAKQGIANLLQTKGYTEEAAKAVETAAKDMIGLTELDVGMVVALRSRPTTGDSQQFAQMSVYGAETFYGTLAVDDQGQIGLGSDPWVEDELFDYTDGTETAASQEQRYRMLDAFYSTAIRNRVPSSVVGEAIALLSKSHDLDAFANPGDRMSLLFGADRLEDDTGAGQIAYIALKGTSVDIECFVFRESTSGEYACYGAKPQSGTGGGRLGMVTPAKGVLTSRFGPRTHPILKTVKMHKGVDFAAPTGTPVVAAFDGTVSYTGPGGGYGNLIKISHAGGMETRYAHLHVIEAKTGQKVRAGERIGQIGTTGRSTGPHLHFELYAGGTAIDPLSAGAAAPVAGSDGGAVETLVNQIIKVESAGNANAKNPLSTATGLGQFIESTWVRMMKTYRPDLVASMNRSELLALRTDPTISRQMVTNLAREGESYLRARGHAITAGRLYLCHFLGAQGAHVVLSSDDTQLLLDVLGAGVINANPFLRGKSVAYVKEWAERKMRGRGKSSPLPIVQAVREPSGLPEFRKEVQRLLASG